MDELDRLLAGTMRDAAGRAPSDVGLLDTVHRRSRRHHRRRVVTWVAAAAVVVAVSVPFVTLRSTRPDPVVPPGITAPAESPPAEVPQPSAPPPQPSVTSPSTSPSRGPSSSPPRSVTSGSPVKLGDGWVAPTFPYALPIVEGRRPAVVSLVGGRLTAYYEATDLRRHADIVLTVSGRKPQFATSATEQPTPVRGHAGTLRTVDVQPARQLTLYWRESAKRWLQLATDDTYTPEQVVALAESLTPASIAVPPPFRLDLAPTGLVIDTVTQSRMVFRPNGAAPGTEAFSTVLRTRRQLTGINRKVNGYDAALTRRDGRVALAIDVTDWNATLEVSVGNGLVITDADLLRFAAGIHILNRSNPE
ncbi:hypothetical protein [Actinoplanes sp. M2I2]|uniref:hypothetical protein n=1 Tax=Actinoplanes sp. M2I2 TaxID=1734444 RepID=UPI00202067B0|nr:hypothetical protein [Actinoplanes sp. M2I2]